MQSVLIVFCSKRGHLAFALLAPCAVQQLFPSGRFAALRRYLPGLAKGPAFFCAVAKLGASYFCTYDLRSSRGTRGGLGAFQRIENPGKRQMVSSLMRAERTRVETRVAKIWVLGPFPGSDPVRPPEPPMLPPEPIEEPGLPAPGPDLPPLPEGDPSREPRREPFPDFPPVDDPQPGRHDPLQRLFYAAAYRSDLWMG